MGRYRDDAGHINNILSAEVVGVPRVPVALSVGGAPERFYTFGSSTSVIAMIRATFNAELDSIASFRLTEVGEPDTIDIPTNMPGGMLLAFSAPITRVDVIASANLAHAGGNLASLDSRHGASKAAQATVESNMRTYTCDASLNVRYLHIRTYGIVNTNYCPWSIVGGRDYV